MTGSKTGILNLALVTLGQSPLVSPIDNTRSAQMLAAVYDTAVEETLRAHPWNCATKRATLALLTAAPVFEWDSAYQLPDDCLRVLDVDGVGAWKVEGRTLVVMAQTAGSIVYTGTMDDESQMDALLRRAISMNLAATVAMALTGSQERRQQAEAAFAEALAEARHIDAIEGHDDAVVPTRYVAAHAGGWWNGAGSMPDGWIS